ncbi:MAG: hypothetical protein ACI85N_001762, partial [Gammaproteobacteria bacterium]
TSLSSSTIKTFTLGSDFLIVMGMSLPVIVKEQHVMN